MSFHQLCFNDNRFFQILCDLLSPADENVKVGLRETTQNTSPHLRSKGLVQAQPQSPVQRQHHVRATSAHHHLDNEEVTILILYSDQWCFRAVVTQFNGLPSSSYPWTVVIFQKWWESLERPGLSRAHSLLAHGSNCVEEGLKRVCSAPQLGDQEKGSLLKRKLSVSDTEPCVVDRGSSKHKKGLLSPSLWCFLFCFNLQIKSHLILLHYTTLLIIHE